MKKTITVIFILLFLPVSSWAATADNCTYDKVKTAYDATDPGGTLTIPACNDGETWTTALSVTKAISIVGNGSTGSNKTKLIAGTIGPPHAIIYLNMTTDSVVRVSGIYFSLGTASEYGILLNGSMTQLRIDNNYFDTGAIAQILSSAGKYYGVVNQNTFYNSNISLDLAGQNTTSWSETIAAGMDAETNSLYIEGNIFIRDSNKVCGSPTNYHIESSQGARWVARYNTMDGTDYCKTECLVSCSGACNTDYHIMPHGNGNCCTANAGTDMRGPVIMEAYNNYSVAARQDSWIFRGGSSLIHDNVIDASVCNATTIYFREEEAEDPLGSCPIKVWPAWDQVSNTFVWNNKRANGDAISTVSTYLISDASCVGNEDPYACCTGSGVGNCDEFFTQNRDYWLAAPAASGGKETLYNDGTVNYTYKDATHKMTFSAEGANAYYPYTTYTCPHPLVDPTSIYYCDNTKYGTAGYFLIGAKTTIGSGASMSIGSGAVMTLH